MRARRRASASKHAQFAKFTKVLLYLNRHYYAKKDTEHACISIIFHCIRLVDVDGKLPFAQLCSHAVSCLARESARLNFVQVSVKLKHELCYKGIRLENLARPRLTKMSSARDAAGGRSSVIASGASETVELKKKKKKVPTVEPAMGGAGGPTKRLHAPDAALSRDVGSDDERTPAMPSAKGIASSSSSSSGAAGDASAAAPAAAAERPTFKALGICEPLCEAAAALKWTAPTRIQAETIPHALAGRDMIGLAETGSGKTGAFALPILQSLLAAPARLFALVLAPTRELAFQIAEQFEALGASIGLKTAVVVGGVDMMTQAIALARKPHVVIGTPGRVVDHLENTKGFSLRSIQYLVMDEADRMLSLDFEEALNTILGALPRERRTFLFSATMTSKVAKLQRASLRDPVRIEVSDKYGTVSTLVQVRGGRADRSPLWIFCFLLCCCVPALRLSTSCLSSPFPLCPALSVSFLPRVQQYLFIPARYKETYLVYVLNEFAGHSGIIFMSTCAAAQRVTLMLTSLGFSATCLHGQMSQSKRLSALAKFKAGTKQLLVATDVASRGLDIPSVDLVLNVDVPSNGKDYIHRVGRTARAGRAGRAVTLVTQYDIELYQRIEHLLGHKLEAFPAVEEAALLLHARVQEALRLAAVEMREAAAEEAEDAAAGLGVGGKRKREGAGAGDADVDDVDAAAAAVVASSMKRRAMGAGIKSAAKARAMGGGGGGGHGGGGSGGFRKGGRGGKHR